MSTRLTGRLANNVIGAGGHREGLVGYRVSVRLAGQLYGKDLGSAFTTAEGFFDISYRRDPSTFGNHRMLEFVARDPVGRRLPVRSESGSIVFKDEDSPHISRGDFIVAAADAAGFLVTLDTGDTPETVAPGQGTPTIASGWGVSHGNAVTLLIDDKAFTHTAERLRTAQESIALTQLFFPVPPEFKTVGVEEEAKLVFEFHPPVPDAAQPRKIDADDRRPERLLLLAADRGVGSRLLIHGFDVPLFVKILVGILAFPFGGSDGIVAVNEGLENKLTDTDDVKKYFNISGRTNIRVREFHQPVLSAGVMHAKLGVTDDRHAWCIGSPFGQDYVDTHDHAIDAPIRGGSNGFPKHDAGFAVSGPAVGDLHRNVQLLWNEDASGDRIDTLPRNPPPQASGGDGICSMQIMRTVTAGRFKNLRDEFAHELEGEKGILEGYLRAIANAEDFIYLETQYFTDDPIGCALARAMKEKRGRSGKPNLQVILVLNIRPDVPFYPFKQRRLITRIRKAIGQTAQGAQQFGVFTRWTHDVAPPRPRLLPIYIHAKLGIVDNKWATIGSANLDGLSLDSCLVGDKINRVFGTLFNVDLLREQRAFEVNAMMFNDLDEDGHSDIADLLRRKLWAEHLGFSVGPGTPAINAAELQTRPPTGWLQLWLDRSRALLQQLQTDPTVPTTDKAHVLPWPDDDTTHKTPLDHLKALGINPYRVAPLKSTREFNFRTGQFEPKSVARMDY